MTDEPTAYVIRAVGFANGAPCPHAGEWLESFDHDAYDGLGFGAFTSKASKAQRFASFEEALEFWRKTSALNPRRLDGQPNRPLTCLSVEIEPLP